VTKLIKDLSGIELDHWVAMALGAERTRDSLKNYDRTGFYLAYREHVKPAAFAIVGPAGVVEPWNPSMNRRIAMEIIDSRRISVMSFETPAEDGTFWTARNLKATAHMTGPTPMIAAMRALVASVYGEEVPE
jgi:hypothetical protein